MIANRINLRKQLSCLGKYRLVVLQIDATIIACILCVCGHSYCERNGIEMDLNVRNTLIDMYSK